MPAGRDVYKRQVQQFQEGFGLPATGLVDKATYEAIYNYYLAGEEE